MPQHAAGLRIEPPVSVPVAPGHRNAATAAPEPPLEPPGERSSAPGLRVGPYHGLSVVEPAANSWVLHLPIGTAPASRSRRTASASSAGTLSRKNDEPWVVRTPAVSKMSFTPIGTPWSGPRQRPAASSASARRAASRARPALTVTHAVRVGLSRSMGARSASGSSRAGTVRAATRLASSASERKQRSSSLVMTSQHGGLRAPPKPPIWPLGAPRRSRGAPRHHLDTLVTLCLLDHLDLHAVGGLQEAHAPAVGRGR